MRFDYETIKDGQTQGTGSFPETGDYLTGFSEAQRRGLLLCWEKHYEQVVISSGGRQLCTINDDGKIRYWDEI